MIIATCILGFGAVGLAIGAIVVARIGPRL